MYSKVDTGGEGTLYIKEAVTYIKTPILLSTYQ